MSPARKMFAAKKVAGRALVWMQGERARFEIQGLARSCWLAVARARDPLTITTTLVSTLPSISSAVVPTVKMPVTVSLPWSLSCDCLLRTASLHHMQFSDQQLVANMHLALAQRRMGSADMPATYECDPAPYYNW
jgi:hypothetical protein